MRTLKRLISATAILAASATLVVFAAAPLRAQNPPDVSADTSAPAHHARGRIVILMVWDGLRPDSVTQRDTPNLFRLSREGVRFDRHHSMFPTLTMVNAAALATGASPGVNGIEGNVIYFPPGTMPAQSAAAPTPPSDAAAGTAAMAAPSSDTAARPPDAPQPQDSKGRMVFLEASNAVVDLNEPSGLAGRLMGLDTVAQEVAREGGYIAIIGKQGPTILFDNRMKSVVDGKDLLGQPHRDFLFISDSFAAPASAAEKIKAAMVSESKSEVYDDARDLNFARMAVEDALPAAKRAADEGRPALIVFWQHNPDLTQHYAGLGTAAAIDALELSDNNLGRIRAAIDSLGIAGKTDLIVVSDHGFATIKLRVVLSEMLVAAGIKQSSKSTDIVVAPNGGADLIYLSPAEFPTPESRRAILQKIVNFASAQEWCGPIFSQKAATEPPATGKRGRKRARASRPYLGWIDGTFNQSIVGLYNSLRSPDLVISFREDPDATNKGLTGPENPAFTIGGKGQVTTPNNSKQLIRPVRGLMYADTGDSFTTGMGMHGAAGEREIHNFCAAAGPDFRAGFVDQNPTSNIDVAPTITQLLGLMPNIGPGGVAPTGRAMTEALVARTGERHIVPRGVRAQTIAASLTLQGVEAVSKIKVTWIGDQLYFDGASTDRNPLGSSP